MKTIDGYSSKLPRILVAVYYRGLDSAMDSTVRSLGGEYNGEPAGSGYCLASGVRDLSISFKNLDDAHQFAERTREVSGIIKVEGHCEI